MGHYTAFATDVRKKDISGGGGKWDDGTFMMASHIRDKSFENLYIKYLMSEYDYTEKKAEKEFTDTLYDEYVYKTNYTVSLKEGEVKDIGFNGLQDTKTMITTYNFNTTANNYTVDLKIRKQ